MVDNIVRRCSLRGCLRIVRADMSAWRDLADYHYRAGGVGAVDKIFAIERIGSDENGGVVRLPDNRVRYVGVIVYCMAIPNVAARNRATNNRYVGLGDRKMELRLLNREMRCISRVVIHPQYRGAGLGRWLVEETLPKAGTLFVEALAVMGRVNPFFVRAGMTRYESGLSPRAARLVEAFCHIGIGEDELVDPGGLLDAIGMVGVDERRFIAAEMRRFAGTFSRVSGRLAKAAGGRQGDDMAALEPYVEFVVARVLSNPVYFLWSR